jgi:hypothetical protein
MSTTTLQEMIDIIIKFKEEYPVDKRIDFIIKSSNCMLTTDNAWQMEYEGKKYLAIHEVIWQALLKQCVIEDNNDYRYSYFNNFSGIPVIEDDELLRKILLDVAKKLQDKINKDRNSFNLIYGIPIGIFKNDHNHFWNISS